MSAKTSAQLGRRTPLSLSGATSKQQSQQQMQRPSAASNDNTSSPKTENKASTSNQKTDQTAVNAAETNSKNVKHSSSADKKLQQQNAKSTATPEKTSSGSVKKMEKVDEKKIQNGIENASGSNIGKGKHQYGKETAHSGDTLKEKKDNKVERNEKLVVKVAHLEKSEKNLEKRKELEKEKEEKQLKEKEEKQLKEREEKQVKGKEDEKLEAEEREAEKQQEPIQKEKQVEEEMDVIFIDDKTPEKDVRPKRTCVLEAAGRKSMQKQQDTSKMDVSGGEETEPQTPSKVGKSLFGESKPATPTKQPVEEPVTAAVTSNNEAQETASTSSHQTSSTITISSSKVTIKSVTTTIDDDDGMELPLPVVETIPNVDQPVDEKQTHPSKEVQPAATSTPGKVRTFKDFLLYSSSDEKGQKVAAGSQSLDRNAYPTRTFPQISGRRSIRPTSDTYTPSCFQSKNLYGESYRRINTELDVTSTTNTSLNVTVGSEVPDDSSFSFFGRGRKRELTPPPKAAPQPTPELDVEIAVKSPKRPRMDIHGLFSVVASPLSMLRSRFSKASIQSSTPVQLRSLADEKTSTEADKEPSTEAAEDEVEVQNVSGISVEDDAEHPAGVNDLSASDEVTVANEVGGKETSSSTSSLNEHGSTVDVEEMDLDVNAEPEKLKSSKYGAEQLMEAGVPDDEGELNANALKPEKCVGAAKAKRCSVM